MDKQNNMLTDKKIPFCSLELWGGIECTINRIGDRYNDQLQYANLYEDSKISQIPELGFKKLRFPILWEKHQPCRDVGIDWSWAGEQLQTLRQNNIDVIAGLLHHGSGPAFTSLNDPDFPYLLAAYAREVATQFPWINYYTPVNEPLTTARFSGLYGIWYPHLRDDRSFVVMLLNQLKAVVLSMQEIRKINPAAKLIQTEDLGKTHSSPLLQYQARFENERRWLTYDFLSGRVDETHPLWGYLSNMNIPVEDIRFFTDNKFPPDVFGINYYVTSERFIDEKTYLYPAHTHGDNGIHTYVDVEAVRIEFEGETGIELLLKEAWERYRQPLAITEVHLHCHREEQLRWFHYVWNACTRLKAAGADIVAMTSWALFGSFGWSRLLRAPGGEYEPGVFDLRYKNPLPTALGKYIKQVSKGYCHHFLAEEKGWWQRSNRFFFKPLFTPADNRHTGTAVPPILIIGKNGTLGKAFARVCMERQLTVYLLSRQECNIAELYSIESAIEYYKPWAIINAAGYVRVDDAELNREQCFRDNTTGADNLASACLKHGVKLVTFSTDLVFDGEKNTPYVESDPVNPLNIYGYSKALSEEYVTTANSSALIIRTSAFFSPWDKYNFIHSVTNTLAGGQPFYAAEDVYISPTYVPDLVHTTLDLLIDDVSGIWHLNNRGSVSWAELAYIAAAKANLDSSFIKATPVVALNLPARRPPYSVLKSEKADLLPSLENALKRYFDEKRTEAFA